MFSFMPFKKIIMILQKGSSFVFASTYITKSLFIPGSTFFGFNCTIDLRNQRSSLWIEQFRTIYFDKQQIGQYQSTSDKIHVVMWPKMA